MPHLIDPPKYQPSDPSQGPYSLYPKIAEDTISTRDEHGGVHHFLFEVFWFKGTDTGTYDSLGLTGEISYRMGGASNALDKVINPTQIQMRLRNDSGLIGKLRGANKRDFQLKITENGQTIFRGYLLLKTKKHQFYRGSDQIELRAYDGLSLLNDIPVSNFPLDYSSEQEITVNDFLTSVERRMGVPLGWMVHTNYNDPAGDEHFPLGYTFKLGHLIRGLDPDERTWGKALETFCRDHFLLQIYQWQGKWHAVGRQERTNNPSSIQVMDLDAGTATMQDHTGPSFDPSNAIRFPEAEVIDGLAEVKGEAKLGDGFLLNEKLKFDSTGAIPYWDSSEVVEKQSYTAYNPAAFFENLGSSYARQTTKTPISAHREHLPDGGPEGYNFSTRFEVSITAEVRTDQTLDVDTIDHMAVFVDLFKLFTVDPEGPLDGSTFAELFAGANPSDGHDTIYDELATSDTADGWFTVKVDQSRKRETDNIDYIQPVVKVARTFNLVLSPDAQPFETIHGADILRYLRMRIAPQGNAPLNNDKGDARLLKRVTILKATIKRSEAPAKQDITDQQPIEAPDYSTRTNRYTGKNQGDSITLKPALSNAGARNSIYNFQASQSGVSARVGGLALAGEDFPGAAARGRLAMQALDLERVKLQCRAVAGTTPLQVFPFDTGDGSSIKLIPVAWTRALLSGQVTITALEARFDTDQIDSETFYGAADDSSAGGYGGSDSGGSGTVIVEDGGGSGITDHGHLDGLGDDDHPQYFNQPRGDARYIRPHTTPELTQVTLNSPASDASHAARAGTRIKVESPLENANGDRLLDGVDVQLRYNPTNFALRDGKLDTIQDIDQDAEMILKALMLKQGLTLDELLGYIKSEDLNGYDYITQGLGISKDSDGNWRAVVDELTVRKRAKFFELVFQELKVFSAVLLNEGMKVDSVEKVATGDWSWSDNVNVFADGATDANGVPYGWTNQYKLFAEKNQRVALAVGDLVRRQAFSGTELGLTQGYIQSVEQGAVDVSDNSTARYARLSVYEGSKPQPGQTFARLGNASDSSRQGGIYMKGSGQDAPYQLMYDGVDTFPKFGSEETIKSFNGNTKGRIFSQFPELDGNQGDYYATVTQGGFFDGTLRSRDAHIGNETSYLRFDPDLEKMVLAGSLLQRTPDSSAQPIPLRAGTYDSGKRYYKGDVVSVGSNQPTQYILSGADTSHGVDPSGSADWTIFVDSGRQGPVGPVGPSGDDGTSVSIKGTLASTNDLPPSGNTEGDGYIIDGDLYVWDGSNWNNVGPFRGPQGPGSPYRGTYDSAATYYGFAQRSDVVYYNGTYWIVQADTGANGSSSLGAPDNSNANWTQFGGVYDNIATGVVLTRDATVTHTLILGTNDPNNPQSGSNGILRSANYSEEAGSEAGFKLEANGGKLIANDAILRGEVHAVSGTLRDMKVDNLMELPENLDGTRGTIDSRGIDLPTNQSYSLATPAYAGPNPLDVYYDEDLGRTIFDTNPSIGMQFNGPVTMGPVYETIVGGSEPIGIDPILEKYQGFSTLVITNSYNAQSIKYIAGSDGQYLWIWNVSGSNVYLTPKRDVYDGNIITRAGTGIAEIHDYSGTLLFHYNGSWYKLNDHGD